MKKSILYSGFFVGLALQGCGGGSSNSSDEQLDTAAFMPGGATTVSRSSSETFSRPAANLTFSENNTFALGDAEFERVQSSGDIGPLFNATSCQGCHLKDGRGNPPPDQDTPMTSMFLRVSIGRDEINGVIPDPIYGGQIQTFGVDTSQSADGLPVHDGALNGAGAVGEAFAFIEYQDVSGQYADGTEYRLQRPVYKLRDASYGDFDPDAVFSPRVASSMQGLGLLEAIEEGDILENADPEDRNSDGISGRANFGFSVLSGQIEMGRFGWKASTPTVLQQSFGAYLGDLGITSSFLNEENCSPLQTACIQAAGDEDETFPRVDTRDFTLAIVEFYSQTLAVNQRDGFDVETQTFSEDIVRGQTLFNESGCVDCHTASFVTGEAEGSVLGQVNGFVLSPDVEPVEALSDQLIWPYSDLLLHDMGGECASVVRETALGETCESGSECYWVIRCDGLADGRDDFLATGSEWRTAPLWNLGLVQVVNPQAGFLHDGRARTIEEAILWHSGMTDSEQRSEAHESWQAFIDMPAADRSDLLAFLQSL